MLLYPTPQSWREVGRAQALPGSPFQGPALRGPPTSLCSSLHLGHTPFLQFLLVPAPPLQDPPHRLLPLSLRLFAHPIQHVVSS